LKNTKLKNINDKTKVLDIINDPLFQEYGKFIFPTEMSRLTPTMTIAQIQPLLPYHSCINSKTTIEIINYLKEQEINNQKIFYQIYTKNEMEKDTSKKQTGLFFFRGKKNAPFAIINAGGGFRYVGSIHESFPHALILSQRGYNAFVLKYRTNNAESACRDLARAISFIFEHQKELEVDINCYSLWGGSAGARMAAYLGSYGTKAFGEKKYPRASTVIMQYTGHSDYTPYDPPTYMCVGENDYIANWKTMYERFKQLKKLGIDVEFHKYTSLSHGFGLGINTSANGWINDAISFWQRQIDRKS